MAMSILWPRPLAARCVSAARIAIVAYSPVKMSVIGTAARIGPAPGSPSGTPQVLIRPPMACSTES